MKKLNKFENVAFNCLRKLFGFNKALNIMRKFWRGYFRLQYLPKSLYYSVVIFYYKSCILLIKKVGI